MKPRHLVDADKLKPRPFRSRPDLVAGAPARLRFAGADFDTIAAQRPLVVEIGCGVGLHPVQYAQIEPEKFIVAIERTREKFEKFEGRLRAHPLVGSRVAAVHGDAIHFLDQSFDDDSIDEVWILFPNPETSKPSRRWFEAPFMGRLVQLMRNHAILYFATNLEDYASSAPQLAIGHGLKHTKFEKISLTTKPDFKPRTHFEKKYFERGETIFNFEFRLEKIEVR